MSEQYWELVEYECQDGKCLMIHNIPKDSKLGALSLDHRSIGEAIVEELNKKDKQIILLSGLVKGGITNNYELTHLRLLYVIALNGLHDDDTIQYLKRLGNSLFKDCKESII